MLSLEIVYSFKYFFEAAIEPIFHVIVISKNIFKLTWKERFEQFIPISDHYEYTDQKEHYPLHVSTLLIFSYFFFPRFSLKTLTTISLFVDSSFIA